MLNVALSSPRSCFSLNHFSCADAVGAQALLTFTLMERKDLSSHHPRAKKKSMNSKVSYIFSKGCSLVSFDCISPSLSSKSTLWELGDECFSSPAVSQLQAAEGTCFSGCFRFSKFQLYRKSDFSFNCCFITKLSALTLPCCVFLNGEFDVPSDSPDCTGAGFLCSHRLLRISPPRRESAPSWRRLEVLKQSN